MWLVPVQQCRTESLFPLLAYLMKAFLRVSRWKAFCVSYDVHLPCR